ncbi:zinc finger CCCH-type antiviral protein 1 isoform X1 [Anolis carolinensis]|uniref:zinc finger CCCH-type antiviral protein 1 isoform X1 n=1 Tax=Anolis carolinensis TaxID=28377 RepID=UPI002F2B4304
MTDPVVCSFITKILCSMGGSSSYQEILPLLGLPDHQLRQILEESGKERFLVNEQGTSLQVLAISPMRLCLKNECDGCEHLHICKNYLKKKCFRPAGGRRACKYSHDILSEDNRKVLKNHELSGLNENELCVLLLQNDPFLLPDVCNAYNKGEGNCNQQDNCSKLHICRYFLKGQCRFPRCKRSHRLMDPIALKLLLAEGLDNKMAFNIQTICNYKTTALARELGANKCSSSKAKPTANQEKSGNQSKSIFEQTSSLNTFMNIDPNEGSSSKAKPTANQEKSGNQSKSILEQTSSLNNFMNIDPNQDVKTAHCSISPQNAEKEKIDEICLYYLFQFCKHKNNCNMIHYHLPYRWQVHSVSGWNDLPNGVEIEKAYCDPSITSLLNLGVNFGTMTSLTDPIRRLSTPSSVTKPAKFVMTTKWLWYWKNDMGQWIEYGKQDGKAQGSNICSDDLENVFLADPKRSIQFQADSQLYVISFKDMTQRNVLYQTQREVRRRPKFVSSEDVKMKKGHTAHSAPVLVTLPPPSPNYPSHWDKSALPSIGFKVIDLTKISPEYINIETLFQKTMKNHVIHRITRIQNPSLWEIFQWQKDQMKKKNGGKDIDERLLFHGTSSSAKAICNDNFDWRICGTNGTVFGKGSYFARDARYSHNYCKHDEKIKVMFVAQVLVGDFVVGNANYTRPPAKSTGTLQYYDSCVDNMIDPSIFVIFEKHQIYPAYMIYYGEEEKKCILS